MNNENNNANGTVLGSVNNTPVNPQVTNGANGMANGVNPVIPPNPTNGVNNLGVVEPNPSGIPNNAGIVPPQVPPTPNASGVPNPNPVNGTPVNPVNPNPVMDSGNQIVTPSNPVNAPNPNQVVMDNTNGVVNNPSTQSNNPAPVSEPANSQESLTPTGQMNPNPAPNYTNPQTINPAPMPGFEPSGTVGTTPPINLDKSKVKKEKKPANKILFIIIILILLGAIGGGTYYILKHPEILGKNSAKVTITPKNLEINLGEKLPEDIAEFATIAGTQSTNCQKDISKVDVTKAGAYTFTVTCGDTSKVGTVTIVDNAELVVKTKTVYKVKGDTTIEAQEFALDDNNDLTFNFVDATDVTSKLNTVGEYEIDLNVSNNSGKTATVKGKLVVLEYGIKGYLNCSLNQTNTTNPYDATINGSYGIANIDTNLYGNMATERYIFTFKEASEYQKYLDAYNKDGAVTINEIKGTKDNTTFDDTNHVITITLELNTNDITTKYGANNFVDYKSIRAYFTNLGYTCVYEV